MVKPTEEIRPTRVVLDQVEPGVNAVAAKIRPRLSEAAYAQKMLELSKDELGNEIPDPTVMEPPIGWKESPTMVELIRKMIRDHEIEKGLSSGEFESFEEADDFEVDEEDGEDLKSGWENEFEPPEVEAIRKKVETDKRAPKGKRQAKQEEASNSLGDEGGSSEQLE